MHSPFAPFPLAVKSSCDDNFRMVVTFHCGSANEPESWPGLAHLLEHSLFLGSKGSDGTEHKPGSIQAEFIRMGGHINASTQLYHTSYMLECPADQWQRACRLLACLLFNPELPSSRIIAELEIIEAEYKARCSDARQQIQAILQETLIPDSDFSRFCAGNKKSLAHNDAELIRQITAFYQQYYQLDNMSVYLEHPDSDNSNEFTADISRCFLSARHSTEVCEIADGNRYKVSPVAGQTDEGIKRENSSAQPACFPAKYLYARIIDTGYEWCWLLPVSLLPAFDHLQLPEQFQSRVRMISSQHLLAAIWYQPPDDSNAVISKQEMLKARQQLGQCFSLEYQNSEAKQSITAGQNGIPDAPAIRQTVQQSIYHHYLSGVTNTELLMPSLLRYLNKPEQITLICHPEYPGEHQTRYFRAAYSESIAQIAPPETNQSGLHSRTEHLMPYRRLMSELQQGVLLNEAVSIDCQDNYNQAALLWLTPSKSSATSMSSASESDIPARKKQAHFVAWSMQQQAYRTLRLEKRLGYIVHSSYLEVEKQPGVLLLVQSECSHSGELILAQLHQFIQDNNRINTGALPALWERDWTKQIQRYELAETPLPEQIDLTDWPSIALYSR
ncbi:insulinase family protein [Oceanospirillum sediminis]|uniref:Insulinase family protein n=1 Tax=Oceanospirillum sediminis TaxID=2760088 RepID=A0A839IQI7_9GAMM|nr:insulinase family protein [Oceanospirillum sediminis]MBB1486759.1 insulinase family protein [Oceanospirillum sediminis]